MAEQTKDWQLYEAGKKYNNSLSPNYYATVDANLAFFQGDQWRNLEGDELPKPVFNIIKRIITFQVASLISSKTRLHFEPLTHSEVEAAEEGEKTEPSPSDIANAQVKNLFEKFKMDFKIKDALTDAAVTGDACAHFYFDVNKKPYGNAFGEIKGEIIMELVDGSNVHFGNANNPRVDIQPYIIIVGRDTVENLREEAKAAKKFQGDPDGIQEDKEYNEIAGDAGKLEVEADGYGKALYIIVYRKDKQTGTIKASKSVENAYIYKDVDTELTHYPVAWLNWEKQKNQYHGRALCTGILPNQIFINRMFAMVMYHLMMTAFPKAVYNADYIEEWDNTIGAAIPIQGADMSQNMRNIAGYLEPGNMSNQIIQGIELAMAYTKETLGVSDAALGQIDPKNTSAIIAVQKSSAIPLENPKSNLYEWIENIGEILFDMMGTYYGPRPVIMDVNGQKEAFDFDFGMFKELFFNVRADVGEASYWSEIAALQTLDRLLDMEKIDFIDYLERIPDEYIPQKQELISKIKQQMEMAEQAANDPANLIAQLTPEEQQAFLNAPPEQQQAIIQQLQMELQAPMM